MFSGTDQQHTNTFSSVARLQQRRDQENVYFAKWPSAHPVDNPRMENHSARSLRQLDLEEKTVAHQFLKKGAGQERGELSRRPRTQSAQKRRHEHSEDRSSWLGIRPAAADKCAATRRSFKF